MTTFKVVSVHIVTDCLPCFSDIVILGQICFLVLEAPEPSFNLVLTTEPLQKEGLEKAQGCLDEIYRYLFEYYKKRNEEAELEKLYKNAKKRKRNLETMNKAG